MTLRLNGPDYYDAGQLSSKWCTMYKNFRVAQEVNLFVRTEE